MKKTQILLSLILLTSCMVSNAQEQDSVVNFAIRQAFFADYTYATTPTGGGYGINFDKRFKYGANNGWGMRIGMNYGKDEYTRLANNGVELTFRKLNLLFPLCVNYITGKKRSHFVLEAGFVPYLKQNTNISKNSAVHVDDTQFDYFGMFQVGYRYASIGDGLFAQATCNPVMLFSKDPKELGVSTIATIGIGYSFYRW